MPFTFKTIAAVDLPSVIHRILNVSRSDTVFWDLYLSRARKLIDPLLPYDEYRSMEKEQASSALLPDQIRTAMEAGDWHHTQELSSQLSTIRNKLEAKRPLIELGQMLYDTPMVPVDPFSPGLQGFAGVTGTGLTDLRQRLIERLETLTNEDPEWRKFYQERKTILQNLVLDAGDGKQAEAAPLANAQLQQEAMEAFKRGNFDRLKQVAGRLQNLDDRETQQGEGLQGEDFGEEATDLLATFSGQTLSAAEKLGLEPARVDSWHEKYGHLCRHAWHPAIGREGSLPGEAHRVFDLNLPADTPEAMKERISMFMIHPFINSGGSRYLPSLVAEDFLVENFPEPETGRPMPTSPLIDALQLGRRDQLSRLKIEQALLDHGTTVVDQLGLDPASYRLVCIPPDLHLRMGMQKNWGQQPLWTHFDGYMIQRDGHRMALAGGDIRFGGVFDMVGIGVNYESDRVFARFAVIQRKRMAT
jgi:hypothetical protein